MNIISTVLFSFSMQTIETKIFRIGQSRPDCQIIDDTENEYVNLDSCEKHRVIKIAILNSHKRTSVGHFVQQLESLAFQWTNKTTKRQYLFTRTESTLFVLLRDFSSTTGEHEPEDNVNTKQELCKTECHVWQCYYYFVFSFFRFRFFFLIVSMKVVFLDAHLRTVPFDWNSIVLLNERMVNGGRYGG